MGDADNGLSIRMPYPMIVRHRSSIDNYSSPVLMLFHTIDFAVFLPIVFFLYWFVTQHNLRLQNWLIVVSSYVFYGWWDWRFLSLVLYSSAVDYFIGLALAKQEHPRKRKILLWISIFGNLGLLGFFKYFNFFVDNFVTAFSFFGQEIQAPTLRVILPVGISFYTFQTLSYGIDVYRRKLEPTRDFIAFSAFVMFFPQLVAGPIERATNLLPQFYKRRVFDYEKAVDGLRQILWGLFKKIVIADNCAVYVNSIFGHSSDYSGFTLVLGAFFFAMQAYGDFSGYSDIAVGTARLFGFSLMRNFAFPFFSRDMAEFWRRWHISLMTWFRDYLYIPLGGSRGGTWMIIRNTIVIFAVSGLWHGANWTYVVFGLVNALYFLPLILMHKNRQHLEIVAAGRLLPTFREFVAITGTFALTLFAFVIFRAETMTHAVHYLTSMFIGLGDPGAYVQGFSFLRNQVGFALLAFIALFMTLEWFGREGEYAISKLGLGWKPTLRYALYYGIVFVIFFFGGQQQQFIYFQF